MTNQITTIGFFGDSFCSDISNEHSTNNNYQTYLQKVATHFNARITNKGTGGSSVWDLVLIQFAEQAKKGLPDVCVFLWTESDRIFHRTQRNLNVSSVERGRSKIYNAAKEFYYHLYDQEKDKLEYISLLYYFDNVILPQYKNTKFVHLWSFGQYPTVDNPEVHYAYIWKNGNEIRPSLITLTDQNIIQGIEANHISGENKNQLIADWIISCLQPELPNLSHQ